MRTVLPLLAATGLALASTAAHADITIYKGGSRWAEIESDGDVFIGGSRKGEIEDDGDIYVGGSRKGGDRERRRPLPGRQPEG